MELLTTIILVWLAIVVILIPILWLGIKMSSGSSGPSTGTAYIAAVWKEQEAPKTNPKWFWIGSFILVLGVIATVSNAIHKQRQQAYADHVAIEQAIPNLAPLW